MSVKPIDTFIANSVQLFEANPSQTVFSLTYKWELAASKKANKKSPIVSFKTHNAHLSNLYKFKTNKSKDVSRLLSAVGPRGVTITKGKIEKKVSKPVASNHGKKAKKNVNVKDIVGLSTLMVNTDVKEYVPIVQEKTRQAESKDSSSTKKKKSSKNKGKKRR